MEVEQQGRRLVLRAVEEAVRVEVDDEAYWKAVQDLRRLGAEVVWPLVKPLHEDSRAAVRSLVPDVLRYFDPHPLREETVALLAELIHREQAPRVLQDIAVAFVDLRHERAAELLPALLRHPDAAVREAAIHGLLPVVGPRTIGHFVTASEDPTAEVRSWATFGLRLALGDRGDTEAIDTDEVRAALAARLDDEDGETRAEAVLALATRRDEKALPALARELQEMPEWDHYIEAAELFASPKLLPLLKKLAERHPDEASLLEGAIAACASEGSSDSI